MISSSLTARIKGIREPRTAYAAHHKSLGHIHIWETECKCLRGQTPKIIERIVDFRLKSGERPAVRGKDDL